MAPRSEILVDSDANGLEAARALIERTATELGFDDGAIWEMKLAATEALTNAIDHGEPADDGVHLAVRQERDHIVFEVWGGAAAPSPLQTDADPRDRGRGIAMMSALMDGVELRRHEGGTRIRLEKRRRRGEAPALGT